MKKRFSSFILVVVSSIVFLDQLTKLLVDRFMSLYQSITIIDHYLDLIYIRNTGAAFGFLAHTGETFWSTFFVAISLIAILTLCILIRKFRDEHPLFLLSLSLILGGAIGNLIDRIRLGEVIDFIDLHYDHLHWPAFNVADSSITLGVALLMVQMIFFDRRAKASKRKGSDSSLRF